ncbi:MULTISPECIES: MCE family protein [Rhodococcus]|uniref:MCE family protein n=1 Tax=Rhodococcus TaxID=1827 RepID=UPI00071816E1|nr:MULTISPECIES: MCE family protein [Rhodococcus]MCZ4618694.1 MCE family protein [Rhodococcus qingshengii]MEA1798472.1 MCE family protein [Rhodococcus qingshengii]ORI28803.1 mammalian cell entry protein [Rhodococcus erythropolis]
MIARHAGLKLVVFLVITSVITAMLVVVVGDLRFGAARSYRALFTSASGMKTGEDVKVAGVPVGDVTKVAFAGDGLVQVDFTVSTDIDVFNSSTAAIKYKNLIGDRYLELTIDPDASGVRSEGDAIPVGQTRPALDIDTLVNGFKPLLQGLDPDQTNELSASLIEVLNGQEQNIASLIRQIGTLGNSLADRDEVIGRTIDNLSAALDTVHRRGDQFSELVVNLQQLVSGLNADRDTITTAIDHIGAGAAETAQLLADNRPAIATDITQLQQLASNLNDKADTLNLLLAKLPSTYQLLNRASGYGNFVNFFVCGLAIRYPGIGGPATTPMFTAPAERCR